LANDCWSLVWILGSDGICCGAQPSAGLSADSHISSGVRGQGIGQAPDCQTARHRCGRLTFVVRPELERLAFGFRGKDLGGCDMDGIERTNVNGERTLGLVDDAGVDSCKVERHEQISQLLPLDSGFGIVKVSDETFAINCAERFDFNELRRDDTIAIAGNQRERWPRL